MIPHHSPFGERAQKPTRDAERGPWPDDGIILEGPLRPHVKVPSPSFDPKKSWVAGYGWILKLNDFQMCSHWFSHSALSRVCNEDTNEGYPKAKYVQKLEHGEGVCLENRNENRTI